MRKGKEDLYESDNLIAAEASYADLNEIRDRFRAHWQRQLNEDEGKLNDQLSYYIPAKLGRSDNEALHARTDGGTEMGAFLRSNKPALLLLGDSGAGKSLFCQSYINHLWSNPGEWLPLFIHLPWLEFTGDSVFESYLQTSCHLSFQQIDILRSRKVKILLFLDSYDEMKESYRGKNVYRALKLHEYSVKVVLSCRTEFLVHHDMTQRSSMFTPTRLDQPEINVDRYYVQFFDERQIPDYIQRWKELNPSEVNPKINYFAELNTLPGIKTMIANPFILWAVMQVLPELLVAYSQKAKLKDYDRTRKALYDRFTQSWFERQRKKLERNGDINAGEWGATIVQDFQRYCQALADLMWQSGVTSLTYEPKVASVGNQGLMLSEAGGGEPDILDKFFAKEGYFDKECKKPLAILRKGALLRVSNGNTFNFLHDSLKSYFSARRVHESVLHMATIVLGLEINAKLYTKDSKMIGDGVDSLIQSPELEGILREIVNESKHEPRVATAAANAISILVAAGKSFAGEDLRNIRIQSANLIGGNFEGADFQDADLRDVNISQAWLMNANLSGTCLDGLRIDESSMDELDHRVVACAFSNCGQYYVVLTELSLYIFETVSHKIIAKKTLWFTSLTYNQFIDLAVSAQVNAILVATKSSELRLFSFPRASLIRQWKSSVLNDYVFSFEGRRKKIVISQDGTWAITSEADSILKKWNLKNGELLRQKDIEDGRYANLALTRNEEYLVISTYGGTTIRNCESWDVVATLKFGKMINIGIIDDWVLVIDLFGKVARYGYKGEFLGSFEAQNDILLATVSKDKSWLLSGNKDHTISIFNLQANEYITSWSGHNNSVSALTLSPDNEWVLSGSVDKTIRRWAWGRDIMKSQAIDANEMGENLENQMTDHLGRGYNKRPWPNSISRFIVSSRSGDGYILTVFESETTTEVQDSRTTTTCEHYELKKVDTQEDISSWYENSTTSNFERHIKTCALSPNHLWVITSDIYSNLFIKSTKNGKILRKYQLSRIVTDIAWSKNSDSIIILKMNDNSFSKWTFDENTSSLNLLCRTKLWGLQVSNSNILGVYGLSENLQRIFSQRGANVEVSTKSSNDILHQRDRFVPYDQANRRKSLLDDRYILRPIHPVITVARKKSGDGARHAVMIIESVETLERDKDDVDKSLVYYYRIRRIEFFLERRQSALRPGATIPSNADLFGQGLIEIFDVSAEDVIKIAREYHHPPSEQISYEQLHRLLTAIYKDKNKALAYCKMGGSGLYRLFTPAWAVEHHNCMSWIRKHLEAIGIDLVKGGFKDFFVEDPLDKIPGTGLEPTPFGIKLEV